jgi:hypothetical protein
MSKDREYILKVGAAAPVKRRIVTSYSIIYAGMLDDSTYSLVVTMTSGYRSMAYNLYLPRSQSEIELPTGRMVVLNVSPQELHFSYQG